jgi:predicted transcriptional regulator
MRCMTSPNPALAKRFWRIRLSPMSDKQTILEVIRRLPDEVSFREIREEIEFLAAVREGELQADQGRLIPLEQVEKNLPSWLSKSS